MGNEDRLLSAARALGSEQFNRLVQSAGKSGRPNRLRFWEEQILTTLARQERVPTPDIEGFVAIFANAELMPGPPRPPLIPDVHELLARLDSGLSKLLKGIITPTEWSDLFFMHVRIYPQQADLAVMILDRMPATVLQPLQQAISIRLKSEYRAGPCHIAGGTPEEWAEAAARETEMDRAWAALLRQGLAART